MQRKIQFKLKLYSGYNIHKSKWSKQPQFKQEKFENLGPQQKKNKKYLFSNLKIIILSKEPDKVNKK